MKEDQQY
jgi:hypothetical protein